MRIVERVFAGVMGGLVVPPPPPPPQAVIPSSETPTNSCIIFMKGLHRWGWLEVEGTPAPKRTSLRALTGDRMTRLTIPGKAAPAAMYSGPSRNW
jgi:hypothetical protein